MVFTTPPGRVPGAALALTTLALVAGGGLGACGSSSPQSAAPSASSSTTSAGGGTHAASASVTHSPTSVGARTISATSAMRQAARSHALGQAIINQCGDRAQTGGGRGAFISCLAAHGLTAPATPKQDACLQAAGHNVAAILACAKTSG